MTENNEMLEAYLFEANSLLEELDELLITCEKANDFIGDSINTIFRTMHTIKGSSAMMEFGTMTTVAHKMEDLFSFVRENGLDSGHNSEMFDLLFKAVDFLKEELERIQSGQSLTDNIGFLVDEISNLLKKISGAANSSGAQETAPKAASSMEASGAPAVSNQSGYGLHVLFDEDSGMENLRAMMLLDTVAEICPDVRADPEHPQEKPAEEIAEQGLKLYFSSEADLDRARSAVDHSPFVRKSEPLVSAVQAPAQNAASGQQTGTPASTDGKPAAPAAKGHDIGASSMITVNITKLDKLMDLMGEIVITESMVTALPGTANFNEEAFSKAARQLEKLTDELQEGVMSMRMVPVSTVFNKMNRIVRDMSKKLNKKAQLVIIGEETEIDKTVIDNIADPIMHIVRNSMDHGLEMPEVRQKAGKPEMGTVTLKAENTAGEILITVEDDGKGFDKTAILNKAKEKGLLTKPEAQYTDKEIYKLLLMPGFSTKQQVTEFSGRGVGMDVVKKNIEKLGGKLYLNGEQGKGSTVTIKIPLTLAIITGMKVSVQNSVFAIPIHSIRETFKARPENLIADVNGQEAIMIRNECYPVVRLHEVFGIEPVFTELCDGICVLVESHEATYCIFADKIIGEQQVVIKSLPAFLEKFELKEHGISGCAILGDGSISLIIDVPTLANN